MNRATNGNTIFHLGRTAAHTFKAMFANLSKRRSSLFSPAHFQGIKRTIRTVAVLYFNGIIPARAFKTFAADCFLRCDLRHVTPLFLWPLEIKESLKAHCLTKEVD